MNSDWTIYAVDAMGHECRVRHDPLTCVTYHTHGPAEARLEIPDSARLDNPHKIALEVAEWHIKICEYLTTGRH